MKKQMIKQTKFGWVDLSNLVMRNQSFDWDESIGQSVRFQYDDIVGDLIITGRKNKQYMYIDIPGYVEHHPIYVGQIKNGQLGCVLQKMQHNFRYNTDDVIDSIVITGCFRDNGHKYYYYKCSKDGYYGSIREEHLVNGHRCPVCAGKQVLKGYNDMATTHPDIAELFYDKNDAFLYMTYSNKSAYFKCPRCGNKIYRRVADVIQRGLSCKKCGDGISYPNKFIYNFIEQISMIYQRNGKNFVFYPEKKFDWSMNYKHENQNLSGNKIYDMYIDDYNIIIENHGDYHYRQSAFDIHGARSFEEVQENDNIKYNLAIKNGIKESHYIVLDCYKSDMFYIKNSIMSSNLPKLLNFTEEDIDWIECDKFATSSRVYEACFYWNNGIKDYKTISLTMKMHETTIRRYIKKGRELGIVNH